MNRHSYRGSFQGTCGMRQPRAGQWHSLTGQQQSPPVSIEAMDVLFEPENALIERAIQRDGSAFASIYDSYVNRVYRYVYSRTSNRTDAEGITQEVFLKAWKAIGNYRRTEAPFWAWLVVIARNLVYEHFRRKPNQVPLDEAESFSQPSEQGPEAMTEAKLDRTYVRNAISKLKGEKREVIRMRFIQGFTYEEIAKMLNKTQGAVRVIQYRALKDLRTMLDRSQCAQ